MPALNLPLTVWCRTLGVVCASLLTACVVVPAGNLPGPAAVPTATVVALKPGATSRVDVLMTLGDPDYRYGADRAFGYTWSEALAWVFIGAGYSATGFSIDEMRMLMIEFDDDGLITRLDIVAGVMSSTFKKAVDEWLGKVQRGPP